MSAVTVGPDRPEPALKDCPLTARQLQILTLVAMEGLQRDAIAYRLGVDASTVGSHMSAAYRRLEVGNMAQAIVVMFNAGWLDPTQTKIQDPTRYEDCRVTDAQRAYLDAFDEHLAAGDDEAALRRAKRRTDAAAREAGIPSRSRPANDWILDALLGNIARRSAARRVSGRRLSRPPLATR